MLYETFNLVEGAIWIIFAILVHFMFKPVTRNQTFAIYSASLGLLLFGISDFIEFNLSGSFPSWLWIYKISCATVVFLSRYHYIGWKKFRLLDKYFLSAIVCLAAALSVIWISNN
jgi:hypothetical protein